MKKNAGFSLVELIVVIAIMAVLVGVLAPAYLKYVEKSRKSSDISSISDMLFAADKVAVDVQFSIPAGTTFTLTVTNGVVSLEVAEDGTKNTDATNEWQSIAGSYTCKSSEFKTVTTSIVGTVNSDGSVSYAADKTNVLIKYSKDFSDKLVAKTNTNTNTSNGK